MFRCQCDRGFRPVMMDQMCMGNMITPTLVIWISSVYEFLVHVYEVSKLGQCYSLLSYLDCLNSLSRTRWDRLKKLRDIWVFEKSRVKDLKKKCLGLMNHFDISIVLDISVIEILRFNCLYVCVQVTAMLITLSYSSKT